jgi:2-polyprenyl-6-hydroxyphenyl methylase/3-demethylubiquinone-9 3-methyltransferase
MGINPKNQQDHLSGPGFVDQRRPFPLSLAARTNLLTLTARGYELWRKRALSLLSGRGFSLEEELGLMVEHIQPKGGTFLDLGSSTGLYARGLLQAGASTVFALDLSPAMLREAARKAEQYPGFVPLLARAEAIPLPDASLDGVVVGGTWNELLDPAIVAKEISRVIKPTGRIWIMFTHRSTSPLQALFGQLGLGFPTIDEVRVTLDRDFNTRGWREKSVGFVVGEKVPVSENGWF